MIRGVIFDLDGLMIDSEPLSIQAWQRCLEPWGASLTIEQYSSLVGTSHAYSLDYIERHGGAEVDRLILDQAFWENLIALVRQDGLEAMPGVLPLVAEVARRGLRLGVASNSRTGYARIALEKTGLNGYFRCVIGADQVAAGKPAPDVYLRAAACLGLSAVDCLAIEDSPVGARAALAAGLPCILVPNPLLGDVRLEAALAIYPSLDGLFQDLDRVLARAAAAPLPG
jgi:HAD superfamily hydrolase (TIGR01509 family)